MDSAKNFLAKYAAYITAFVTLLVAVLQFFGVTIPGIPHIEIGVAAAAAFGLVGAQAETTK